MNDKKSELIYSFTTFYIFLEKKIKKEGQLFYQQQQQQQQKGRGRER